MFKAIKNVVVVEYRNGKPDVYMKGISARNLKKAMNDCRCVAITEYRTIFKTKEDGRPEWRKVKSYKKER